jgi:hypothetical protein
MHLTETSETEKRKSGRRHNTLIAIYLILAFSGYFISLFITRLGRIKELLGL